MSTMERTGAQQTAAEEWKYAEKALTWSGWGSPVGLSIFILAIGAFLLLIHHAGIIR